MSLGKEQDGPILRPLHWANSWLLAPAWHIAGHYSHLRSEPGDRRFFLLLFSLYLPFCSSNLQMNKSFWKKVNLFLSKKNLNQYIIFVIYILNILPHFYLFQTSIDNLFLIYIYLVHWRQTRGTGYRQHYKKKYVSKNKSSFLTPFFHKLFHALTLSRHAILF